MGCNITLIYIYGNEKIENNKAEDKENLSKVHEDNEAKTILASLSELGIKLYAINIEEDIQAVFKQGGKRN